MLNEKERQLAAHWLGEASDRYGNHGCNDVEEKIWDGWTKEERKQFVKEYHEYNGDPEEFDPNFLHLPDFAIMGFLAYKLRSGI
jgi:hypothetical protein